MSFEKLENSLFENDHFQLDLCKLQGEERTGHLKKQNNHLNKINTSSSLTCHHDIHKILNENEPSSTVYNSSLKNSDRLWIINHIQNRRRDRQSLQEYLRKNQEIFKLEYTLNIKHEEIERWETYLRQEENLLTKAEKYIVEDLTLFDQFLDTCSRNANEAASRVEEESRKKDELVNEIKRLQRILISYHNDQNHLTDILKQSRRYQQFLFKFAPKEWRIEILQQLESKEIEDKPIDDNQSTNIISTSDDSPSLVNENYSIYFTKPEQLLDIFTEMEEKSLPLVEKSQYTSEILDKIQSNIDRTKNEQNQEVEQLKRKTIELEELIQHEIQRENSCKNILIQYNNEKNDPFIEQIKNTIEILYKKHISSDNIGTSTIHMLQTIENKIKSLLNIIEHMDSSAVMEAEKFRENSIRTMERQEKLRQEKLLNQIKHQKTLLRTSAPPYRKIGRIIMERSRPLSIKKHQMKHSIIDTREQLLRLLEN